MATACARSAASSLAARRALVPVHLLPPASVSPAPRTSLAATRGRPRRCAAPVRAALDVGASGASLGHFLGAFAIFYSSITWANLRRARLEAEKILVQRAAAKSEREERLAALGITQAEAQAAADAADSPVQ